MHIRGVTRAVDTPHHALLVVELDQRLGLVVIDAKPVANHVRLIVVALNQARAVLVADSLVLGRIELGVVVVPRLHTHPSPGQPTHKLLVGHVDQQRGGHASPEIRKLLIERFCLLDRPWEAVEDESVPGIGLLQALGRHRNDQPSGTSSPASMYSRASLPSSVPSLTLPRSMSPVEMNGS